MNIHPQTRKIPTLMLGFYEFIWEKLRKFVWKLSVLWAYNSLFASLSFCRIFEIVSRSTEICDQTWTVKKFFETNKHFVAWFSFFLCSVKTNHIADILINKYLNCIDYFFLSKKSSCRIRYSGILRRILSIKRSTKEISCSGISRLTLIWHVPSDCVVVLRSTTLVPIS